MVLWRKNKQNKFTVNVLTILFHLKVNSSTHFFFFMNAQRTAKAFSGRNKIHQLTTKVRFTDHVTWCGGTESIFAGAAQSARFSPCLSLYPFSPPPHPNNQPLIGPPIPYLPLHLSLPSLHPVSCPLDTPAPQCSHAPLPPSRFLSSGHPGTSVLSCPPPSIPFPVLWTPRHLSALMPPSLHPVSCPLDTPAPQCSHAPLPPSCGHLVFKLKFT